MRKIERSKKGAGPAAGSIVDFGLNFGAFDGVECRRARRKIDTHTREGFSHA